MRLVRLAVLPAFTLIWPLLADPLPEPKLEAVPSSRPHQRLIQEGIQLHDQRDYDGAIAKYQQVLKENPDDVLALYELSFSYFAAKNYRNCAETALRGARYRSEYLSRFYSNLGSCLDDMGKTDEALEVYKAAIQNVPGDYLLHFNLGLTYLRRNQPDDARKSLKNAITLNPNHPSSHFNLGKLYAQGGYRIPALFAFWRLLILEPASPRSGVALQQVQSILGSMVKTGKSNEITIMLQADAKKDEGDFTSLEMSMAIGLLASDIRKKGAAAEPKTEAERLIRALETMLAMLAEHPADKNASGFAYTHYVPYFAALKQHHYVEPFVYFAYQSRRLPGGAEWLHENRAKVGEFLKWSNDFRWSEAK